jgi:ubiquinone/menaquinone biosynthesis C-methylase UbiE
MAAVNRFSSNELYICCIRQIPVNLSTQCCGYYQKNEECSGFHTALDVACGSGQSTFLLCESFQKVTGVVISQTQIDQARMRCNSDENSKYSNFDFILGDAHNLPIESSSVDLLTCATAWHWLDAESFYAEARRVLNPRGCLAVYGHGSQVEDNERMDKAMRMFLAEMFKYGCFAQQNLHVLNKYEAVKLPFQRTQRIEFSLSQEATFEQIVGLISSISMYRTYGEKFPNNNLLQRRASYDKEPGKSDVEISVIIMGMTG